MIIDQLTVAGLVVTSLFALMPILMGREFFRVQDAEEAPRIEQCSDMRSALGAQGAAALDCLEAETRSMAAAVDAAPLTCVANAGVGSS